MNTIQKLTEVHKRETNSKIRERLLMIIGLMRGESSYTVGKHFNCPHSKVLYWKYRFKKEGIQGLRNRPIFGKPSKISEQQVNKIKNIITEGKAWKTSMVREMIKEETGVLYTERHTVRLLHKWGFERISPRKRHMLSNKEEQEKFLKKTKKS